MAQRLSRGPTRGRVHVRIPLQLLLPETPLEVRYYWIGLLRDLSLSLLTCETLITSAVDLC